MNSSSSDDGNQNPSKCHSILKGLASFFGFTMSDEIKNKMRSISTAMRLLDNWEIKTISKPNRINPKSLINFLPNNYVNLRIDTDRLADPISQNASLRIEIGNLRSRVDILESESIQNKDCLSNIFRESTERSKIEYNVIAYEVPESNATSAVLRTNEDIATLSNYLKKVAITMPSVHQTIRLGNNKAKKPRPLKIIYQSKSEASQLLSNFTAKIRDGASFPDGFRLVRDKTTMERELLRKAYTDLERCKQEGITDLVVAYVNGVPSVTKLGPKTRIRAYGTSQRPNYERLHQQ